jgi:hypothetical protein
MRFMRYAGAVEPKFARKNCGLMTTPRENIFLIYQIRIKNMQVIIFFASR